MSKPNATPYEKLVHRVAASNGLSDNLTRRVLATFTKVLAHDAWATGRMSVPGLATFTVRSVVARQVTAVRADGAPGRRISIKAHRVMRARVSRSWRRR